MGVGEWPYNMHSRSTLGHVTFGVWYCWVDYVFLITSLCSATEYADNVTLPAFARRTQLLLPARRSCSNRSISSARRAHSSKPAAAAFDGRMGQKDGWTQDSFTDPNPHTMRAMPITNRIATTKNSAKSQSNEISQNRAKSFEWKPRTKTLFLSARCCRLI